MFALYFSSNSLKGNTSHVCFNDSSYQFRLHQYDTIPNTNKPYGDFRRGVVGNFCGSNRQDFVSVDAFGNIFLFRNEKVFSLSNFVNSLRFDTLLAAWQNPHLNENQRFLQNSVYARFAMRVLPKPNWDHSDDFVARFTTDDHRPESFLFFQGGSSFGSKRLYIDSPSFEIQSPDSRVELNYEVDFCGDMTGTGNPVINLSATSNHQSGYEYYYVMGNAIDAKVDISIPHIRGVVSSPIVRVDADGDLLQDILYQVDNFGGDSLQRNSTSLWVLHGSKQIPVHITSVEGRNLFPSNGFSVYPNPANAETTIRYNSTSDGYFTISLFDLLGRKVYHSNNHLNIGENILNIQTEKLLQGIYSIVFEGGDVRLTEKIVISH